ncbi:hypothetical protein [Paenibacillus arenilitoris]|uniref:Uncharacterized protein n=1 Tax=Paenibacillus arenilitoris TaxID=2772299 RepID=A0A927CH87_9BACL|nr:hypothetical protein [Paenibacillus arenilitoris]MBD2867495.1 hypothetical protein [Paenibacillus arenilitoris]
MFDPTVFENLKVAFENELYDLDNLDRAIDIANRTDRLDMAVMAREFALQFRLAGRTDVTAELRLRATLADLAAEILETEGASPGCSLQLRFHLQVSEPDAQCGLIEEALRRIWQPELTPKQTISRVYGQEPIVHTNRIELDFNRQINEEQMEDIPELARHMLQTLKELRTFAAWARMPE